MTKQSIKTYSEQETARFGSQLAKLFKPGDVVTLEGDLGAGKTAFTKGLADGLGVRRTVNSPTFTMIKEYSGDLPLYHMDVYRLEDSDEDLGFAEYFYGDGLCVVEWANFISDDLPDEYLAIKLSYVDDHTRLLELLPQGEHYESVVANALR